MKKIIKFGGSIEKKIDNITKKNNKETKITYM